ncbi:uncharacterized protein C18orf63 homolog isoform X1 [Sarcophilus harrisii]|uniref:Chromosome 18 open reading frame 63 n=1 Tax=Sarcophilus harrisii TaxID=9305 RepID=G3VZG9_SARHA|nr:uncharacterized protein C18orf63 homolog isoform X1 [Sarcophilus harrisii]XP_031802568.1 uncharacterized protein C18orf63 homolog isoform X1 [Sarcophilus harrisii]
MHFTWPGCSLIQSAENMSFSGQQSLFFISLPDLQKLYAVKVILSNQVAEIRSVQMKMCRQLLLMHQELLTSPVPGILNQIWVVMAIPFYKSGKLQAYTEKHGAKVVTPQKVVPAILQTCLSYSVTARLSPSWNKAGHLLIQGRDFLSQTGKQSAVVLDINVTESQLCLSIEVCTIRLPPPQLNDFDISENILKNFDGNKHAIIEGHSILSNWCYVLPSMKMGQITNILHTVPPDCPFRSHEDFQMHWDSLYGYNLPEDCGKMEIYFTVYFKLIGEKLFTYPINCIRSQPVQFFPRVDMENVLKSFLLDLKSKFPHICGFPIKMTSKPYYYTQDLIKPSLRGNKVKTPNLTTKKIFSPLTQIPSIKPTLVQSPFSATMEFDHKMELLANQPKPSIFSSLNLQPDYENKGTCDEESQLSFEASRYKSRNIQVQDVIPDNQNKSTTKIIPIFKSRLIQMNENISKPVNQKKKQHIGTESKIFAHKSCVTQVNKLNLGQSEKKRTKNNTSATQILNANPKSFIPPQDLYTKSNFYLPKCTSSHVSLSGHKLQFPGDSVFHLSDNNSNSIRNVMKIQKKENLASQHPIQVLGNSHELLQKKRQLYIFESDTETEESLLPQQQSVNPTKEVDLNICRLVSTRQATKSKRKSHQKSPENLKNSNIAIHHGPFNSSAHQGKGLSKSKPKKSQIIPNI